MLTTADKKNKVGDLGLGWNSYLLLVSEYIFCNFDANSFCPSDCNSIDCHILPNDSMAASAALSIVGPKADSILFFRRSTCASCIAWKNDLCHILIEISIGSIVWQPQHSSYDLPEPHAHVACDSILHDSSVHSILLSYSHYRKVSI